MGGRGQVQNGRGGRQGIVSGLITDQLQLQREREGRGAELGAGEERGRGKGLFMLQG